MSKKFSTNVLIQNLGECCARKTVSKTPHSNTLLTCEGDASVVVYWHWLLHLHTCCLDIFVC